MKQFYTTIAAIVICGCSDHIDIVGTTGYSPTIYPDYADVVIPPNIAPLNFCVTDTAVDYLVISGSGDSIYIAAEEGNFNIPEASWHKLISANAGKDITLNICQKTDRGYLSYQPISIHVSTDSIDNTLVYRLIPPGYAMWNRMGLYQRNLETFEENNIYDNRYGKGNCANCHSFCNNDSKRMLFHLRKRHAGTYIFIDGKAHKLGADMSKFLSNPVYPYWHPSGRFVAFSTNKTFQMFHNSDMNHIEVGDDASDVVIYDVENDRMVTTKLLSSEDAFETFPCFSPDGKSLYFCSAKYVETVERNYKDVKYSLCRIDFNAENMTFGNSVDTLYNAEIENKSVSFPRVSPDGEHLAFTVSGYGNFSIWHKDADLYMLDLKSGSYRVMAKANSDNVESYHSWSSNSRWLVFSSRRDDGLYTRPYFAYINEEGEASKPFMLPQISPKDYYQTLDFSYNIPELIKSPIDITSSEMAEKLMEIW